MNKTLKQKVLIEAEALKFRLIELSTKIHNNPELSSCEYKASSWLSEELKNEDFDVILGVVGLDTAFDARYVRNPACPSIGFMAEYDALPEMGHGCGHSLIAPASVGAAIVLKKILPPELTNLAVLGTPAEETSGGKLPMLEMGSFKNIDVSMMFHPHTITTGLRPCVGRVSLVFEFFGKPAHASAFPDNGINALDAIILTFNNINALRQQLREDVRIHGIITDGGKVTNIIPDYTRAEFFIRSRDCSYLDEVTAKVRSCAEGAATATGAELKISSLLPTYLPDKPIESLIECFENNLRTLGLNVEKVQAPFHLGSSDFGNVSQKIPSLMGFIEIAPKGTPTHSTEFAKAAESSKGHEALINAVKGLAMTAIDILTIPGFIEKIKKEFNDS